MKLFIYGLCAFALASTVNATELYLEGISILGGKKKAFITVEDKKITAVEGDVVEEWTVERIEQRSIFLRKPAQDELKELPLHGRMGEELPPSAEASPASEAETAQPMPEEPASAHSDFGPGPLSEEPVTPVTPSPPPPTYYATPPDPKEIPAGHHLMQTPFGYVVIKDKKPSPLPAENIPPAH